MMFDDEQTGGGVEDSGEESFETAAPIAEVPPAPGVARAAAERELAAREALEPKPAPPAAAPFTGLKVTAEGIAPLDEDVERMKRIAAEGLAAAAPGVVGDGGKMPAGPMAPPDLGDAFKTKKADEYFYDESTQRFWLRNEIEQWVDLNETGLKRHLKKKGLRDKPNLKAGENLSEVDEKVSDIEKNHRVAYAGLLAGYKAGVWRIAGRRVLVSEDPQMIEPVPGDWAILREFFDRLLVGEEPTDENGKTVTIDQRPQFFAWLQHVVQCFRDGRTATGLALCMAGEPNCGKSFLAMVLRWILGGRVARPYNRMIGRDQFNRAEAESVLLLVDDDNQSDTRLEARLKFGGEMKMIVANNEFQLRTMHRDGFAVEVLRRLVVLVNLQLSRLMVLPPLDGDINDKLMLLKGYARPKPARPISIDTPPEEACWPSPMPTRTEDEKQAYRDRVRVELPAFLWWLLNEFKMPSQVSGGRFVVREWHHPAIKAQLSELSPHVRIWELILRSQVVFHTWKGEGPDEPGRLVLKAARPEMGLAEGEWRGRASDLEQLLKSDASKLTLDEKREIPQPNWLGQRLQACAEHFGEDFCRIEVKATKKTWILKPRPEDRPAQ